MQLYQQQSFISFYLSNFIQFELSVYLYVCLVCPMKNSKLWEMNKFTCIRDTHALTNKHLYSTKNITATSNQKEKHKCDSIKSEQFFFSLSCFFSLFLFMHLVLTHSNQSHSLSYLFCFAFFFRRFFYPCRFSNQTKNQITSQCERHFTFTFMQAQHTYL